MPPPQLETQTTKPINQHRMERRMREDAGTTRTIELDHTGDAARHVPTPGKRPSTTGRRETQVMHPRKEQEALHASASSVAAVGRRRHPSIALMMFASSAC